MKRLILLMIILLMMPFVLGATDTSIVDDTFKINDVINYAKPCFSNGTYCTANAECNFTIFRPDDTLLINNLLGTNNGANHNLTVTFVDNGVHQIDMICNDNNLNGAETFYANITGSGLADTYWFYVIILAISFGVMVIGFSIKDPPFVIFGSLGLYFVALYILFNGIVGIKDMVTTWAIGLIILGLAFYISIRSTYELIVD